MHPANFICCGTSSLAAPLAPQTVRDPMIYLVDALNFIQFLDKKGALYNKTFAKTKSQSDGSGSMASKAFA